MNYDTNERDIRRANETTGGRSCPTEKGPKTMETTQVKRVTADEWLAANAAKTRREAQEKQRATEVASKETEDVALKAVTDFLKTVQDGHDPWGSRAYVVVPTDGSKGACDLAAADLRSLTYRAVVSPSNYPGSIPWELRVEKPR